MIELSKDILNWVFTELLSNSFAAFLGFLFGRYWLEWWKRVKYGGWTIEVLGRNGKVLTKREISPTKVQQILAEESDLSQYVKGVASTYEYLNEDPCERSRKQTIEVREGAATYHH
jgi:hypothetical protein